MGNNYVAAYVNLWYFHSHRSNVQYPRTYLDSTWLSRYTREFETNGLHQSWTQYGHCQCGLHWQQ